MWLPKDERRMLSGYYSQIGTVRESKTYHVNALRPLLKGRKSRLKVPEHGDAAQSSEDDISNREDMKVWVDKYFNETNQIKRANKHLHERGLIVLEQPYYPKDVFVITLTVDGYDLGRKYSYFLTSSGLWFEEYRNHWLWLIVAFLGGAIFTKLFDIIVFWSTSHPRGIP